LRPAHSTLMLSSALLIVLTSACKKGTQVPEDTGEPGPVIIEHCGEVSGDETWDIDATHILTCDVTITGSLTLDPGVEVYADRDIALRVEGGTLLAAGSSDQGILIGSHEGYPRAGDWVGLVGADADIQLSWVTLRHAGSTGALVQFDGGTASLEQISLSNGISTGLSATGTSFDKIQALEIAYVPTPLELPWTAAQVLSAVFFQEVGTEAIILSEATLEAEATLPEQDFPYLSQGVAIQAGGRLDVGAGAVLEMAGDIVVRDGSIVAYGDQISGATIQAYDPDTGFAINIGEQAEAATFRYATITGALINAAAEGLYFADCDVSSTIGTPLVVTGSIQDDDPDNFTDNSFAGYDVGLIVDYDLLPAVGVNTYSGSLFDGLSVAGGEYESDITINAWPSDPVLFGGVVDIIGGSHSLSGGNLVFADGMSFSVSGGSLTADGMSFEHQTATSGGWSGIDISAGEVSITGSTVSHGGLNDSANITLATDATITGNTISYSTGWGILVQGDASPTIADNSYQNNALGDVGP